MTQYFSSLEDKNLINLITSGAVGVLPTDTVYGLVAAVRSPQAVTKLYATKPRELAPGTIIAASVDDLVSAGFRLDQLKQVEHYWPASLSVVLDAENIDPDIKQVRTDLPVRIPNNPALANLLKQTGPLMTTSANAPKQPTSTSIAMAESYFGDSIDYYVDGGDLSNRPPSTIIGIKPDNSIEIYRQGAVEI
jgi:tRNA threonylcarbamoyl adenosine modification protein (Sua5/YciO/YrdC/YwlC family)